MSLKSLMQYLKSEVADTSDTSAVSVPYQRQAPIHAGCTPDTSDTSHLNDVCANVRIGAFGEAVNDPAAPALESQPSAAPPAPSLPPAHSLPSMPDKHAKPRKQTFMEWQDTWLHLDRASQAHHFKCPHCIAAGKGYGLRCGAGAALYTAYSDATQRTTP